MSVHTVMGVLLGIGAGIWAISVHKVLQDEATILLAVMGAAVALLAVILAAVAIMAGFLSGFFGEVIETSAGLRTFFRPFRVIARVSAAAALVSLAGAMDAGSGAEWFRAVVFGLSVGLMTWAIVGTVMLISVFLTYAIAKREVEGTSRADPGRS